MDRSPNLHAQLAAAARDLQAEPDTQHTMERSVHICTELVPGCDYAGISISHRHGNIDTPAWTDELVKEADALQYQLQEGPCLDAIWHHDTIISPDLSEEARWPTWAPTVSEKFGVAGMLCVQLFTTSNALGGLNLYSNQADAFDDDSIDVATYLAAHVAVAVAETQNFDQLRLAAVNRTLIGQAQGILMERFSIDASRAFDVLRRVSQDNNVKLRNVAQNLITTRHTPGQ